MLISNEIRFPAKCASNICRAVMTLSGVGSFLFNDRRANGGRSIKVWGWRNEHYELAADIMRKHGFDVELKRFTDGRVRRIWTTPTTRSFPGVDGGLSVFR